jgi:hypothetical protein
VEVKFSHLSRNMTLQRTMKLYRLPDVSKGHVRLSELATTETVDAEEQYWPQTEAVLVGKEAAATGMNAVGLDQARKRGISVF